MVNGERQTDWQGYPSSVEIEKLSLAICAIFTPPSLLPQCSTVYEGDWTDSKRDGMGELRRFDGAIYRGPWKDDRMHGEGGVFT